MTADVDSMEPTPEELAVYALQAVNEIEKGQYLAKTTYLMLALRKIAGKDVGYVGDISEMTGCSPSNVERVTEEVCCGIGVRVEVGIVEKFSFTLPQKWIVKHRAKVAADLAASSPHLETITANVDGAVAKLLEEELRHDTTIIHDPQDFRVLAKRHGIELQVIPDAIKKLEKLGFLVREDENWLVVGPNLLSRLDRIKKEQAERFKQQTSEWLKGN